MNHKIQYCFAILLICICSFQNTFARKIHNNHFKFIITLPDQLVEIKDSSDAMQGDMYYDTIRGIILLISGRESKFRSVNEYIDCATEKLEQQLQQEYGDTSLVLLSCNKAIYYPKKTA